MKKLIKVIIVILLIYNPKRVYGIELIEEITPIRNEYEITGIIYNIEIPKNYNKKEIELRLNIFKAIEEYINLNPKKDIKVIIKINNKSKYNYKVKNNSFYIKTIEPFNKENLTYTNVTDYNKNKIYYEYVPNRIINEKIIKNNNKSLSKYYLKYYNKESIDKLNSKEIKEIFTGKVLNTKEIDPEIIKLIYKYYYKYILNIKINNKINTMYKYNDNTFNNIKISNNNITNLPKININLNKKYYTNNYDNFRINSIIGITLKKD